MLPDEWRAEEDDRDEGEAILEDIYNVITFPADEDVAEANAIVVEWFCIVKRILGKDSLNTWEKAVARSCWDRIKEDKDVAVAKRVEELVMEGGETEESPCDSNMAATLLFMEPVVLLLAMEITLYAKKPLINWVTMFVIHPYWIKHTKSCQTHQNGEC